MLIFLYYNISREKRFFKRACARARKKRRKKTKIAGNGLSGRFDIMFEYRNFAKESKKQKELSGDGMGGFGATFLRKSPFGA